jgi:hypothetical protein
MKSNTLKIFLMLTILVSVVTSFNSCGKKDETCILLVKVVNLDGSTVTSANVRVTSNYATVNGTLPSYLPQTKLTDGTGFAEFEFKLPAILDIEVTTVFGSGQDLVKLVPGETVSKTVIITP